MLRDPVVYKLFSSFFPVAKNSTRWLRYCKTTRKQCTTETTMAVPFSNTKLRVPKGFQNILECLAREVLRSQPDNIHEFAAAYFEKMLKVRTGKLHSRFFSNTLHNEILISCRSSSPDSAVRLFLRSTYFFSARFSWICRRYKETWQLNVHSLI